MSVEQQSWCGGIWGNSQYPRDNPPRAPYVVLTKTGEQFAASFALGDQTGVEGATSVGRWWDRIWIPLSTMYNDNQEVVGSDLEHPMNISITRPPDYYDMPFDLSDDALDAVRQLTDSVDVRWNYALSDGPMIAAWAEVAFRDNDVSLQIEKEQLRVPPQLVVVGGLRAVIAYKLDGLGEL